MAFPLSKHTQTRVVGKKTSEKKIHRTNKQRGCEKGVVNSEAKTHYLIVQIILSTERYSKVLDFNSGLLVNKTK